MAAKMLFHFSSPTPRSCFQGDILLDPAKQWPRRQVVQHLPGKNETDFPHLQTYLVTQLNLIIHQCSLSRMFYDIIKISIKIL